MKTDEANSSEFNELCKQARGLGKQVKDSQEIASEDIQLFIHELQMNQLELEMRNGELHRIKQELEDSRNKYLDLFELAPVGYFTIDKDGIILEVNLTGANLLGMERKYLVKTEFPSYVATDYHDTFYSYCKKLFETKTRQTCELKLRKNDGTQFYAQLESMVMWEDEDNCSKFRTAVIDITERKEAEVTLKESEEKFRVLAEQSPHMIFINKGGRVTYANKRCEEITGYKRDEFYSPDFDFKSLIAPEFIEVVKSNFQRHIKDEEVEPYEYALITKDGKRIEAIIATRLINYNGERAILGIVTDITERKRTEEAIRESEEKYRILFEESRDAIYITTREGKFIDVNQSAVNLFGYAKEEMMEMNIKEIYANVDDRKRFQREIEKNGFVRNFYLKFKKKSGKAMDCLLTSTVRLGNDGSILGYQGIIRDITERKRAEERLRRQGAMLKGINKVLLETLTCENDEDMAKTCLAVAEELTESKFGFICEVNQAGRFDTIAISAPGWDACVIPKTNAVLMIDDLEIHGIRGRVIKDERAMIFNNPASHPDWIGIPKGHPRITRFLGVPLKHASKTIGMIGLANKESGYDLTDKKAIETLSVAFVEALMRKRAEVKLKQTMAELKRSNAELEKFAYIASHDLQNPLKVVLGYLQRLKRRYKSKLDTDAEECIAYAVDGANWMQALINDLLSYSRVGVCGKDFELTDCEAVFERALANLQVVIEENEAVVTHDSLPTVTADVLQFTQLFQNLIGNAIKFRREEPPRVHVWAERKENEWLFSVRDNGIGIEPKQADKIFGIFQRLHNRSEFPGTGVGLAICKKIVECHGGRIWMESEPDNGSTFYFTIPIKE